MMDEQQDTEFTLGVGKLLGLFFLLVILCGVFFSLGYSLGRGTQKFEATAVPGEKTAATQSPEESNGSVKTVTNGKSDADIRLDQTTPDAKSDKSQPATAATQDMPELKITPGGAYVVQVAAVTKKEDAEALQQALEKKQYPVTVSPGNGDKLFHVQIGPFAELKDADTMKSRLAADGYNAIVKK